MIHISMENDYDTNFVYIGVLGPYCAVVKQSL